MQYSKDLHSLREFYLLVIIAAITVGFVFYNVLKSDDATDPISQVMEQQRLELKKVDREYNAIIKSLGRTYLFVINNPDHDWCETIYPSLMNRVYAFREPTLYEQARMDIYQCEQKLSGSSSQTSEL